MIRREIFAQMKLVRKTAGKTQYEMADIMGVSGSRYSQLERQEHISAIDNFIAFINAHGFDIELRKRHEIK